MQRGPGVGVENRLERPRVRGHRLKQFLELYCRQTSILIDYPNRQVFHLAAKCIPQNHQLHQRHDHRNNDQRWTAPEPAQIPLDDGQNSMHAADYFRSYMNALLYEEALWSASRS